MTILQFHVTESSQSLLFELGGPWPTHYWPCCNFVCHYNCT